MKRSDLAFVLGLTAFQAAVIAGPFLVTGSFYNDTLASYGLFYDQLDSLHRYGEPAWWSPHVGWGAPSYASGLLGAGDLGKPAFVSIGLVAWALGRVGIPLPPIHWLYLFHGGVLIPFLLLLGVWLVARAIFRSRTAVLYTLVITAFSPAVLFNLGAPGITENTAYGLMFTAAFLRFIAEPDAKRRRMLCAAALLVCVAASSAVLVSSVPLLLLVIGTSLVISSAARSAVRGIRLAEAAAAIALLLATVSPSAIAYVQERDRIVQTRVKSLGSDSFGDFGRAEGIPGGPPDWDSGRRNHAGSPTQYRVLSLRAEDGFSSHYLGVPTMPLAAIGLAIALRRVRHARFAGFVLVGAALVLLASKPSLAPLLLGLPAPVAGGHFLEASYREFGFLALVFAAGSGLEVAERRRAVMRGLILVFIGCSLLALPVLLVWTQPPPTAGGFVALMAACVSLILIWSARLPRRSRSRLLGHGLIALALLDVSTAALWYLRPVLHARSLVVDAGREGKPERSAGFDVTTDVPALRSTTRLVDAGVDVDRLPFVAGFCAAHLHAGPSDARDGETGFVARRSLPLPEELRGSAALAPFFAASPDGDCSIDVEVVGRSYNALQISVQATRAALVFVRDSSSAGWKATVNGSPSPVLPAAGAFKAVAVPVGVSRVELVFSPPWVGAALLGSYALLVAVAVAAAASPRRSADPGCVSGRP
jgi:hypothetical protein